MVVVIDKLKTSSNISTSNHVIGSECIFENFEISLVTRGQLQNLQKPRGWFMPRIAQTKHVVVVNYTEPTNTLCWN